MGALEGMARRTDNICLIYLRKLLRVVSHLYIVENATWQIIGTVGQGNGCGTVSVCDATEIGAQFELGQT